jgi:hypothetical protein
MEALATSSERRRQRLKTFKGGAIIYGLVPPVDCIVRNLSDTGAAIQLVDPASTPDAFQLLIKPEMIKRTCNVVWRSETRIGVRFG